MSKAVGPRDTKPDSETELTNSTPLPFQGYFLEKESRRLYRIKLDNRRIGLDRKSGQALSDPRDFFTKTHAPDFHSEKTVDRSILRVKTRNSPRTVSAGESPLEKRGAAILFSRRERALWAECMIWRELLSRGVGKEKILYAGKSLVIYPWFSVPSTSLWTSVSFESASIPSGVVWNFDLPSSTTVSSIPRSSRRVMYFSAATKLMFDR